VRIAIGSDHAGYDLKVFLRDRLASQAVEVHDVGPDRLEPGDDYPDFARAVADSVARGERWAAVGSARKSCQDRMPRCQIRCSVSGPMPGMCMKVALSTA